MARIAVIGAGMGSMATAARLAVGGHRVVVHEQAETYGGVVGRFARDGFAFDTGPGLLLLPAVYRDLFVKTGKESLEQSVGLVQADPASRHVFADGTGVSLPNASRSGVIDALDGAFGAGSGERWSELLVRAREVWEVTRRPLLEDALGADPSALGRDPYPGAARRGLFRRGTATLARVAAAELRDPRLVALLEADVLGYGLDPRTAPAAAVVLPYVEQTFGVWYVRGGMRALADAVYARCVARKVEFRFGSAVSGLLEKDGRVAGVELADGGRAEAEFVVAGAPLPAVPWAGTYVGPSAEPGRLTVHLALRGARPAGTAHRTVVHAADRTGALDRVFAPYGPGGGPADGDVTVTVLRPDDPATRPDEGHEAVTVTATVPPHSAARAGSAVDWTAPGFAEACAARVVAAAEAAVPGLRERELWRAVRTPADVERETGAPGGSVPAPALAGAGGAWLRAANRGDVAGLYVVGAWAHPGGGLPHVGMSAAITADLIAGGPGGSR
ncbi:MULTISPECIES: phytoene desaturase family protein [unclassified Streptomyces]|uniref:phytoene desaturase family protein n=1 Tax=unclassified Streptomyces TaxID=2593676 RepID=UPI002E2DEAA4|nr:NAD(P)/FAD-dependent oxidoreductase [Streptomyces sp. NBC_00223]